MIEGGDLLEKEQCAHRRAECEKSLTWIIRVMLTSWEEMYQKVEDLPWVQELMAKLPPHFLQKEAGEARGEDTFLPDEYIRTSFRGASIIQTTYMFYNTSITLHE